MCVPSYQKLMPMVGAFVFIQSKLGRAYDVARSVEKINGVKWTCAITGVYDVIAYLELRDMNALSTLVIKKIQRVEGIERTHTGAIVFGEAGDITTPSDFDR